MLSCRILGMVSGQGDMYRFCRTVWSSDIPVLVLVFKGCGVRIRASSETGRCFFSYYI